MTMNNKPEENRIYVAIDLKSFYASVECVLRGYDPFDVNLVVADETRTEKTICLAASPAIKAHGVPGRARLFEVVEKAKAINAERRQAAPGRRLTGKSFFASELNRNPSLQFDFIIAPPQMAYYMKVSTEIFNIYLKYVAPEDIHVYSIDEVFIDATNYLATYKMNPREFTMMLIKDVLSSTGITATAGIGTNLYLCKIAMDIEAKHIEPDENGVRIAELDEMSYREKLWSHRPLTDFWRIGRGYATKLEANGFMTMGDVARCSINDEDRLYKLFGVNAELLIDHAWGWENAKIADIKAYTPENNSLSSGQVLPEPYSFEKGRLIVREMTDLLVLDLVKKRLVTDQMVLTVCYDVINLTDPAAEYSGEIKEDHYGRRAPKPAHGSINLGTFTSSTKKITEAVISLYERIVNPSLFVRRMYVVANHIVDERSAPAETDEGEQLNFFTDYAARDEKRKADAAAMEKEKRMQLAVIEIQKKHGKNAILKGMNLEEGATTVERNNTVGGHKA